MSRLTTNNVFRGEVLPLPQGGRYADCMTPKMQEHFLGNSSGDNFDLTPELELLRGGLRREVEKYGLALEMPSATGEQIRSRAFMLDACLESINTWVQRVAKLTKDMDTMTKAKADGVVVNTVVQAVTQSVDRGLSDFEQAISAGGVNASKIKDHLSNLIQSAAQDVAPVEIKQQDGLSRKTTITSDHLVQEMDTFHLGGEEDDVQSLVM